MIRFLPVCLAALLFVFTHTNGAGAADLATRIKMLQEAGFSADEIAAYIGEEGSAAEGRPLAAGDCLPPTVMMERIARERPGARLRLRAADLDLLAVVEIWTGPAGWLQIVRRPSLSCVDHVGIDAKILRGVMRPCHMQALLAGVGPNDPELADYCPSKNTD